MNKVLTVLAARGKKYFFLLLCLCVILSVVGWFAPAGKGQAKVQAEAVILAGNYDNSILNNIETLANLLNNESSFQKYFPDVSIESNQLQVFTASTNQLRFIYSGLSEEESSQSLSNVIDAFLELDNLHYRQKKEIITNSIDNLQGNDGAGELLVEQQRFLYELETQALKLQPAMLVKDVTVLDQPREITQKDRAVLGFLIGFILSVLWIAYPIFLKSE